MSAIIVSGIVLTILLLSLVISKRNKLYADKFLILYLLFSIITQLYFYINYHNLLEQSAWLLLVKGVYLLNAPLFFFYVYALVKQKSLSWHVSLLTLAPFFGYCLMFFYYYLHGFKGNKIGFENGWLHINGDLSLPWAMFAILFLLIEPFFLVWFYLLLKRYRKKLLDSVSSTESIHLTWLNTLFYIWLIIAMVLVPIGMLSIGSAWLPTDLLENLVAIGSMAFVFVMGYYGFKQTAVFSNLELILPDQSIGKYTRSGLTSEEATALHKRLLELMLEKKPYLNGQLSARDLAMEVGISVNYLSQILSKKQSQHFFDFVNSYRVEEVKQKMNDAKYQRFTLLAIALESGFNSKTSFNTIFKKFTGQTPSQYYRSIEK